MEILGLVIGILGLIWAVYVHLWPRGRPPSKPTEESVLAPTEEIHDWITKQNKARIDRALREVAENTKDYILPFSLIGFFVGSELLVLLPIVVRVILDAYLTRSARKEYHGSQRNH